MRFPKSLPAVALLLLLVTCASKPDNESPTAHFVYPLRGETIDPGVYVMKAIATDDQAMHRVSFWAFDEMLGIVDQSKGDTYSLGIDCRTDTMKSYVLGAIAEDQAGNQGRDTVTIYVRR